MQASIQTMTNRERFLALMEYQPIDRVPNWEVGVWPQTIERWVAEGLDPGDYTWDWFTGEDVLGLDAREFIPINYGMIPPFKHEVLESDGVHEIIRDTNGIIRKALIAGTVNGGRMCMDQYLRFPVETVEDFRELKKRFNPHHASRYPNSWRQIMLPRWQERDHVLIYGRNCSMLGFYWRAREWMGTEKLSLGWYWQPDLLHEMMEFIADFTIETSRAMLDAGVIPDYIFINEDMSMKTGPLLSPDLYRQFILPHMKRVVDFFKSKGTRYVMVDTDGNCEPLIPALMDAGVDGVWPIERAAEDMDPWALRRKYGRELRLWGAVDKRALFTTRQAVDQHLLSLAPLIEDGGFIPTIDHCVSPDVPLDNWRYYLERKELLLRGELK